MKPQARLIKDYVKKWVPIIGLQHWDIKVRFYYLKDTTRYASATTLPQYNELVLDFNLTKVKEFDEEGLEKLVLHELCHAPIAMVSHHLTGHRNEKMISYLDEQATSTFANALWRATGRKLGHV